MRFHPLNILHIYLISCPIIILSSPMIQKGILLRGPNWPYTCFRFYDIILENLVTLIWELTTLVSHFSYFCYLYCVLNYLIQLSDIISENQVGNPDVGASCRDQTFFWISITFVLYFTIFYPIIPKIWWVILIRKLAALIKLFLYFMTSLPYFSIFYPIIR